METSLRLRLIFENGEQIFTKTQLKLGLNKSLIFLQPHQQNLHTIADLSAYIIKSYNLEQSCPRGLVLTIDGFALPPFETISILKDQDIISVKKKGRSVLKIEGNDGTNNVEQKDHTTSGILLLANEEFEKDQNANSEEEIEEGEISVSKKKKSDSKKRKGLEKSSSPKKKKQRGGEGPTSEKKKKVKKVTDSSESDEESTPRKKKELKEDNEDKTVSGFKKKGPSRSARRKKASRRWRREMRNIKFNAPDLPLKDGEIWTQAKAIAGKFNQSKDRNGKRELVKSGEKDEPKGLIHLFEGKSSRKGQNGNKENEVYPRIVRPGHIRFEPLDDDEDETEKRSEIPVETYQWNGITSKKQGQKWGTNNDKNTLQRGQNSGFRNNGKNTLQTGQYSSTYSYTKGDFMTIDDNTLPNTQNGDIITQVNELLSDSTNVDKNTPLVIEDSMNVDKNTPQKIPKVSIEFEKLPPLSIPKEGDVIAYRLLELSTSWTPEMTDFRVGKIAWYNANTSQIRLSPVEEYPINFGENDESKDNSNYCEDGSLQIDFKALMNVRLLNNDEVVNASLTGQNLVNDQNGDSPVGPTINKSQTSLATPESGVDNQEKSAPTPGTENQVINPWEQFSEALNSKKEELTSNGWGEPKKDNTPPKINGWDEPNPIINYGPPGGSYGRGPGGGYGRGPGRGRGFGPRGGGGNNNGRGAGTFRGAWRGGAMGPTMARLRSEYKG